MSLASALESGRRAAEALMVDTFTAYEPGWGKVDGLDERVDVDQGSTPGRLTGPRDPASRTVEVGGVERPVIDSGLSIPLSSPAPKIGWEYVCTAVGASSDPENLNRRFRVVGMSAKSHATARRLDIVEVD